MTKKPIKLSDYLSKVIIGKEDHYPSTLNIYYLFYLALAHNVKRLQVTEGEFVCLMQYFQHSSDTWNGELYGIKLIVQDAKEEK